jgi:hypothetical protein
MNKKLRIVSAILVFAGIQTHLLFSQVEMIPVYLDDFYMGFSIPKSFNILKNDSTVFSAGDSVMNMTIYPIDASGIDSSNIVSLLSEWAAQNGVEVLSNYEHFSDVDNYYGVLCAGTLNSYYIMLMLALDPVFFDMGFYLWFSYQDGSLDTVISIIDSLYPQ